MLEIGFWLARRGQASRLPASLWPEPQRPQVSSGLAVGHQWDPILRGSVNQGGQWVRIVVVLPRSIWLWVKTSGAMLGQVHHHFSLLLLLLLAL